MNREKMPNQVAKYELLEEIGCGGFAVVYRARDMKMGREVALKVVQGSFSQEHEFTERFYWEARTAAHLRHPNVIPIYDFGDADGTLYLAMPLVGEGRTLRDLIADRGPLSLTEALPLLAQVAEALAYLHEHDPPLVHRDIKPANVLLEGNSDRPIAVLADFGLLRSMETSTQLTRSSTFLGTPAYMAPEQVAPEKWGQVSTLTDVYALGVVAYEMLTGEAPFTGETLAVLRAHADDAPLSPLERIPDLGEDLAQVLLRALAKPPGERYRDARALVAALRQVVEERAMQEAHEFEVASLLAEAQAACQTDDWLTVQDRCVRIMQIDRGHPDALSLMTKAMAGLQRENEEKVVRKRLAELYACGIKAQESEQWQTALEAFEKVAESNADFRDVKDRLVHVRDELQLALWYDEALSYGEKEHWEEACHTWLLVLRDRLDYRQGDAVARFLTTVETLLRRHKAVTLELERVRQALTQYDNLAAAVETGEWAQVVVLGETLLPALEELDRPVSRLARARQVLSVASESSIENVDDKEMVLVESGPFLYGPDKSEIDLPEFWIDKTPVTNAEYAFFVEKTGHRSPSHWGGSTPPKEITDHPVTCVSWHDANTYAEWAGKRLPTEQQWAKAARGVDGRAYPWGEWAVGRCNSEESRIGATTPVGQYSPQGDSPYGCVDMAGNVGEWTASRYEEIGQASRSDSLYDQPRKPPRTVRGGSFYNDLDSCTCVARVGFSENCSYDSLGFRCVSPTPPS